MSVGKLMAAGLGAATVVVLAYRAYINSYTLHPKSKDSIVRAAFGQLPPPATADAAAFNRASRSVAWAYTQLRVQAKQAKGRCSYREGDPLLEAIAQMTEAYLDLIESAGNTMTEDERLLWARSQTKLAEEQLGIHFHDATAAPKRNLFRRVAMKLQRDDTVAAVAQSA